MHKDEPSNGEAKEPRGKAEKLWVLQCGHLAVNSFMRIKNSIRDSVQISGGLSFMAVPSQCKYIFEWFFVAVVARPAAVHLEIDRYFVKRCSL